MKLQTILLNVHLCGLMLLAGACGKSDNASPAADKVSGASAPKEALPGTPPPATPVPSTGDVSKLSPSDTTASAQPATLKTVETRAAAVQARQPAPQAAPAPPPAVPTAPARTPAAGLAGLSQNQMVSGLREALAQGLQQAVATLGHDGGFLTNLNVRIPMPEKLKKVENVLRALKQDKLADEFVATMNHAAEQAVPAAAPVFADALRNMTIQDAESILTGPNDAATRYFAHATETNLYARFYPIVQQATAKTGVTAAYKNLLDKANLAGKDLGSLGGLVTSSLLGPNEVDLDAYVTDQALQGLYKTIAAEEVRIRQNPVARTTDLLQKVFGALRR